MLQIAEHELKAKVQNSEEQMSSIELNGTTLTFSDISSLQDTTQWPASSKTRSVIADMLKLDSYQRSLYELDEKHELRLVEFNEVHGYEKLEQQIAGLDSL